MEKRLALLCRVEDGSSEALSRQMKRLSSYAKESEWNVEKISESLPTLFRSRFKIYFGERNKAK